jgi:hypothetical protein
MQAGVKIRKITTASSRDIENTNHGYDFNQLVPIESLGIGKWKPLINFGCVGIHSNISKISIGNLEFTI